MTIEKPAMQGSFFKDKDGHTVLWQWPNIPLYGWIVFKILGSVITQKHLKHGFDQLSMASLFTWSYLEVIKGVDYFRRLLGLLVIILLIIGYFK